MVNALPKEKSAGYPTRVLLDTKDNVPFFGSLCYWFQISTSAKTASGKKRVPF